MTDQTDVLPDLAPLFAAEREKRLNSMERAVHQLAAAGTDSARARAVSSICGDAHSLKGAAQMEARLELCELTTALERQLDYIGSREVHPPDVDLLLRTVGTLRLLSRGIAPARRVARAMVELQEA